MSDTNFDIKKYLKSLRKTLVDKDLMDFYVMCDRKDFEPIKGYKRPKDLIDMFAEKIQYYKGKRVAHISFYINEKGIKNKDDFIFSTKIVIYKILDNGKLSQNINDTTSVLINYRPDDFENRRFYLKDVEKFMRLCADDILFIETLNGQWYKKVLKMLKKKGIDFEND